MKLIRLDFVLENCEVVSINISNKHIDTKCYGLKSSCDSQRDNFWKNTSARYVSVRLSEEDKDAFYLSNDGRSGAVTAWERLTNRDVTSLCYVFEDKTEEQIYVPWKGEWINSLMKIEEKSVWSRIGKSLYIIFDGRNIFEKIRDSISSSWYFFKMIFERSKRSKQLEKEFTQSKKNWDISEEV